MVGQHKLINNINICNIPNPLLIVGNKGMGKHTLVNLIVNKLNRECVIDISDKFTPEVIDELYINPISKVIVIDLNEISHNKRIDIVQNSILKFIEEPPADTNIILLVEYKEQVLDTIKNRCQIWTMESYTADELISINNSLSSIDKDIIENIIKTPKNAIEFNGIDKINDMFSLSNTIAHMIGNANLSNTLTITNKVDILNKENDKFNLDMFLNVLLHTFKKCVINENDKDYMSAYKLTSKLINTDLKVLNVNKKYLFDNYLINLKLVLR